LARGRRGHPIARLAAALAWLRQAGVIIALVAIATSFGTDAIVGSSPLSAPSSPVAFGIIVTAMTARRTRHG
jgi:hypothetical protein